MQKHDTETMPAWAFAIDEIWFLLRGDTLV